jgi:hypothetical protein
MTNCGSGHLTEYGYRWETESGYRSIKRFMAATTSKNFGLRFFYFAFACLLYSIWRAIDLLVHVALTGVQALADCDSGQYADAAEEGDWNRVGKLSVWVSTTSEWLHCPRYRKRSELVPSSTKIHDWGGI